MKRKLILLATALTALGAWADLPVKILNNSGGQFADGDIYVAIIGKQGEHQEIYYDLAATANEKRCVTRPLATGLNRLHVKADDWGYADIFTKMSDIKDHTIYLGNTFACRMFVAFKSPMYLHVHEAGGYAGADMNNPSDPNADIRWELIEFTYEPTFSNNTGQIWINTTRVDAFQYPMGLELYSKGDVAGSTPYIQRGEYVDYNAVINKWNTTLGGTVYKDCLYNLIRKDDLGGIIKQPSKVQTIKDAGLFNAYIDKVWDYFRSNTANINMGVLGRWEGRVNGDTFVLTCKEGTYWNVGEQAHIYGKPTTEDAIEGAGEFAKGQAIDDRQRAIDLTVQAMFCAAFNRGQFRTQTALQNWDPENGIKAFSGGSSFPCNEYVKFFHDTDITVSGGRTYAFAYDDTFDQSATCYSTAPYKATVTIGGFVNGGGTGNGETPVPPTPAVPSGDMTAAPRPDKDARYVKSIFSNHYTSIAPGMVTGQWGQATRASLEKCGGDEAYRMDDFNYQGFQLAPNDGTVDVTDMEYIHIDFYAMSGMTVNFYPISLYPTSDNDRVAVQLPEKAWSGIDVPLASFPDVDFSRLGQFKFDGGNGQTFFIDNVYLWKKAPVVTADAPADVPVPAHDAANVRSVFSSSYPAAIATNVGGWGQTTEAQIIRIDNKDVYKLTRFNYLGLEFEANNGRLDVSGCTHMHVDYWTPDGSDFGFTPISPGNEKGWKAPAVEKHAWNSYDVPLSYFSNVNFRDLFQVKFDCGNGNTAYITNVYFYNANTASPSSETTYNFARHEGESLRGDYSVVFSTEGTTVKVKARFSGDYFDSPGAYFWLLNDNGGLMEFPMVKDGEWYTLELRDQKAGTRLNYRIMLPIAGGRAITKEGAYYIVGGVNARTNGYAGIDAPGYTGTPAVTPNPAVDRATVSVDGKGMLSVFDMNGRIMVSMPVENEVSIEVSSWPHGMYILHFISEDGKASVARLLH